MRTCRWNNMHPLPRYPDWPWPLCPQCDEAVRQHALELIQSKMSVTYPAFGPLVPPSILHQGGFWQYHIQQTLEGHHHWIRHTARQRDTWTCGLHIRETHFHPPDPEYAKEGK
jgi:hypothetical protein